MHRGDQCRAQRGVAAVGAGEEVVPRPGSEVGIVLAAAKVAFGRLFRGFGHRRSSYGGRIALANQSSITDIGRVAFAASESPAMTSSARTVVERVAACAARKARIACVTGGRSLRHCELYEQSSAARACFPRQPVSHPGIGRSRWAAHAAGGADLPAAAWDSAIVSTSKSLARGLRICAGGNSGFDQTCADDGAGDAGQSLSRSGARYCWR